MGIFGVPPQTWFPVITLIIGALLKALFDALTDRRTLRREREARREQRLDAIRLRRVEFQRATLLELQEAVSQLARSAGKSHHEDVIAYRTSGAWRKQQLSEEADQGFLKAQTAVGRLHVRVRDQEIRQLAKALSTACVSVVLSTDETAAESAIRQAISLAEELHERIGIVLRSLDEDEDKVVEGP